MYLFPSDKDSALLDTYTMCLLLDQDDFVAVYKPPGRESVSESGDVDVVAGASILLPDVALFPVHRLDRDTSGVQLLAKNSGAKKALEDLFRTRKVSKEYVAICLGVPTNRKGIINRRLSQWAGGRRPIKVVRGGGGLEAMTEYRVIAENRALPVEGGLSLIAFQPHQGRTHQIRVHAAALGYPILGDDQYGDRPANKWAKDAFGLARQALHSRWLRFPRGGGEVEISCQLPDDMRSAVGAAFPFYRDE